MYAQQPGNPDRLSVAALLLAHPRAKSRSFLPIRRTNPDFLSGLAPNRIFSTIPAAKLAREVRFLRRTFAAPRDPDSGSLLLPVESQHFDLEMLGLDVGP